jgi:hypothetical protein
MKRFRLTIIILFSMSINATAFAQGNNAPVNYLNTPVSLNFNNNQYSLSWTSHPNGAYFKQEYLTKGDNAEKFTSMLMLEVLTSHIAVKDAAANKMSELQRMKSVNPFVSFETSYNAAKDEQLLDFMITANSKDGKDIAIAERNVYRYTPFINAKGEKGLLLFAVSVRRYGAAAKAFVNTYPSGKSVLQNQVKDFKIPAVSIK